MLIFSFACVFNQLKPKGKRFTTAKATQNMAINIEELMSPSEDDDDDEEDEWHPEKSEKGRRVSKKTKTTGVSSQTLTVSHTVTDGDHKNKQKTPQIFAE